MKVAMVDPAAYSLPYDTGLCGGLARAGAKVTLYTTEFAHGPMPEADGYEIVRWFYRRRLPLKRRWARALQHPSDVRRLARKLRNSDYDIVHVQWSVVDRLDLPAWAALPMPVVFTAHNATPREGAGESVPPARLRDFDAIVAHSQHGAASLRNAGLGEVWHLRHGALDRYAGGVAPASPPLELPDTGPLVVLPGLLRPYKGVDVLLEAWPLVHEARPDATLVIAGRPMGINLPVDPPPGVRVLPRFLPDEEFGWLVRRADIVCLPYRAIDLSGVLFSAMAAGTPSVISDVGGFAELRGAGAELVPVEDPIALGETLARLLGDPERLAELAHEARRAASGPYSWDAIAHQTLERYGTLAGRTEPVG